MKRLFHESIRQYAGWLALAVFCMGIVAAATALSAWLMEPVVNELFIGQNRELLWLVGGAIILTFAVKGAANYGQAVLMSFVGLRIVSDSQNRLFAHLAHMDLAFFHRQPVGNLISRFTVDIHSMRGAVSNALTSLGKDLMSLIGLVTVMFLQDLELALIAFVVFPIAIYPIVRLGRRLRKAVANTQKEMGILTSLLTQTFQGIRVVKAYGMEAYEATRVAEIVERTFKLTLKSASTRALSSPIMETLGGVAIGMVIVYGGYRVIENQTDPGSFFSFITALLMAYEPMKRLANLNASIQEGLAGAERMFAVLDTRSAVVEKPDAVILNTDAGHVHFDNVSFGYESERSAITRLTLDVPAGKTVALVGPSGAGKTTILNLIPRFYDVDEGAVRIDDTDVRDVSFTSLLGSIAIVSQEVTLFDDTVRANIAYGRLGATDKEIEAAAESAAAHDFIQALPEGYDTLVGEHGLRLSGGQRQRLAIARAMLKNAPILLLDEATSALDTKSERQVQAALEALMKGRTALVIAHRLSTVVHADLIYVITEGQITEQGTHDELIAKGGHYAHLYELQFREHGNDVPAHVDGS